MPCRHVRFALASRRGVGEHTATWDGGKRESPSGERTLDADGKLGPVGNTVDVEKGTYTNDIGASQLVASWEDRALAARRRMAACLVGYPNAMLPPMLRA